MDVIIIAAIVMLGILGLFVIAGALMAGLAGLSIVIWFAARVLDPGDLPQNQPPSGGHWRERI
jgi:hypothetical protein